MNDNEFRELLATCHELSSLFPGIVYIGGVAIYLHATNHRETEAMGEVTHDADFYISMADMADLRDVEEVTTNRRLSKSQIIKRSFEFDIYTERQSALLVPYADVAAYSVLYGEMRVAALEHLLVLKCEAACDRAGSAKGDKDARDLVCIGTLAERLGFDYALSRPFLSERHLERLAAIAKGSAPMSMARGNAQQAKTLRAAFSRLVDRLGQGGDSSDKAGMPGPK